MKMADLATKVSFELTPEGAVKVEIAGKRAAIISGIMTLTKQLADSENVSIQDILDEMKELDTASKTDFDDEGFAKFMDGILGGIAADGLGDLLGDILKGHKHDCNNCDAYDRCTLPNKTPRE